MKFNFFSFLLLLGLVTLLASGQASALSGSSFQAGRIIDDSVFYNSNAMSVADIQNLLNQKVPTCDTYGNQPFYGTYGGRTYNGNILRKNLDSRYPAPYTCLRDYVENPTTRENNLNRSGAAIPGGQSAAQIIYNEAQLYGINPQVLLVMIQKESIGGLLTDDWPWPTQYRTVMGYACPDTAACDTSYMGFYNQVHNSARQYRIYANNATSYRYQLGQNNILFSPTASCGTTPVNITNIATLSLYIYTPYTPNQAALNNLYGTGDNCSAYGNRNFWRYFNDYFGSTTDNTPISGSLKLTAPITLSPTNPVAGQNVTVSYKVKNTSSQTISLRNSLVQCRLNSIYNCDAGYQSNVAFSPGAELSFNTVMVAPPGGNYVFTPYGLDYTTWYRFGSTDTSGPNAVSLTIPDVRLTSPITIEPAAPSVGQPVRLSYRIMNYASRSVYIQNQLTQCRDAGSANCDSATTQIGSLLPGEERTISNVVNPANSGGAQLRPYFMVEGQWFDYRGASSTALDVANLSSSPLALETTTPVTGQAFAASLTLTNQSPYPFVVDKSILQCRLGAENCDSAAGAGFTLAPQESRSINWSITTNRQGAYNLVPYFLHSGLWYKAKNVSPTTVNATSYTPDLRLISPITTSPSGPVPGQTVTVSYQVKNFATQTAWIQNSILQCRYNATTNCDAPARVTQQIAPGDTVTYTETYNTISAGSYTFRAYYYLNGSWQLFTPVNQSDSVTLYVPKYNAAISLVAPPTVSPIAPNQGQAITLTYSLRNDGAKPAYLQNEILQCRRNVIDNCDQAAVGPHVIEPGAQKNYTVTLPAAAVGSYTIRPYFMQYDTWVLASGTGNNKQFSVAN